MTSTSPEAGIASTARRPLLLRVVTRPLGLIAGFIILAVLVLAVIGPVIAPMDPNYADIRAVAVPPSPEHLLGTDGSGRDVLSRLLLATQNSVGAALLAVVTALLIGVSSGLVAGYYQGWFNTAATWVTELNMALPGIVVLLAARATLGPSVWLSMLIFGVLLAPAFFRLVYASVTAVRGELYVDAARVSGLSDPRILGRHVLRVVRGPIVIQTAMVAGIAIAIQSGLEFLGLGDVSDPTWGTMLNDAFYKMYQSPLLLLWPSLAITLTCIALALVANVARDELDRAGSAPIRSVSAVDDPQPTAIHETQEPVVSSAAPSPEALEQHSIEDPTASEPVLEISDLRIAYADGQAEVVHGVSLTVHQGEVHGLIGESGSGKTQTAFAVLGLLPRGGRVTGGEIRYRGLSLTDAPEATLDGVRGRRIAYIPQEPMSNLDPAYTVGSHLVAPMRKRLKLNRRQARDRALELLARVGIPDPVRTFGAYPFEISGGMAQRVLIAGAVSTDPELIIADEPTTALDVTVQAEVLDLLRSLQKERNMAVLLVTHNFGVVADLCDRVTVMKDGYFVEQGPVRSVFTKPRSPYTTSLLGAILDPVQVREPLQETAVMP